MAASGLRSSIWASAPSRPSRVRHQFETRSRSVPAEPGQQQYYQHQQHQHPPHTFDSPLAAAAPSHSPSSSSSLPPPPPPTHRPPTIRHSPVSATTDHAPAPAVVTLSTSNPASRASSIISPALAFHRFEQACQRLRWKYIDLSNSYKRALSPDEWGFSPSDAERSFKVDFYEFYAWIEQTLVLALLVFGIAVSRERDRRFDDAPNNNNNNNNNNNSYSNGDRAYAANGNSKKDSRRARAGFGPHSYHHNVLRALGEPDNPLHAPLGSGDVNHALWKAKELRNRWKDAADGLETPPLKMYDLTWIVTTILGGLERTYGMAYERVEEIKRAGDGMEAAMEVSEDADAWEWMVEMDWES